MSYNNDGDSSSYVSNNSDGWLLFCHHNWKAQMKKRYIPENTWSLSCYPNQERIVRVR